MATSDSARLEDIELELLLEGVYQHYGYDFRNYARASLKRRLAKFLQDESLDSISAAQGAILHEPARMQRFLSTTSVDVTAMFRDPDFFLTLRRKIVPLLRRWPFVRIWHAGCATGEEVYSLAILLQEEGLYDQARIYATDLNEAALQTAKAGIYPLRVMRDYTDSYNAAGGTQPFSEYYTAKYDNAILRPALRRHIVWAQHNLVTDASFNEFHVIVCRNVMIYFNMMLQERVLKLFYESLAPGGILALGKKESLRCSAYAPMYRVLDEDEKLYRKLE